MFLDLYRSENLPLAEMAGTFYPDAFTHPRLEYEALIHTIGLIDLSHVGVLRLTGTDRVRFLNAMVTNDVAGLTMGSACAALLTTTRGRIVADLLVLARADDLLVLVMQGATPAVFDALESHIVADDVTLEDLTGSLGVLSVEGPRSREVVWRIFPRESLPLEPLKFTENEYQGMHATVVRHSVAGDKGFHLIVARDHIERMRNYLIQGGVGMDASLVGRIAWNMRRVENGLPWYGADVSDANFPAEARLDDHVSYEKGCYLGQETIARMHYRGHPNWSLVGLSPEGPLPVALRYPTEIDNLAALPLLSGAVGAEVPRPDAVRGDIAKLSFAGASLVGAELTAADEGPIESVASTPDAATADAVATRAAGRITSAVFSPALRGLLLLGYVRAALVEPGARFHLHLGGETVSLAVVDLPLKGDVPHA